MREKIEEGTNTHAHRLALTKPSALVTQFGQFVCRQLPQQIAISQSIVLLAFFLSYSPILKRVLAFFSVLPFAPLCTTILKPHLKRKEKNEEEGVRKRDRREKEKKECLVS